MTKKWKQFVLWLSRCFPEYRSMEKLYFERSEVLTRLYAEINAEKLQSKFYKDKSDRLEDELKLQSGRLHNQWLELERCKAEVATMREVYSEQVHSLQAMVDWFGLESRNRSVFGIGLPKPVTVTEGEAEQFQRKKGITGREASRLLTEEFLAHVASVGKMEPPAEGAVFSSVRENPVI